MRKWLSILVLLAALLFPLSARAQQGISFAQMSVQLWPEYDRPSMLAIYDFTLSENTSLPAKVTLRIPAEADLNAVARHENNALVNVPYDAPVKEGEWLVLTLTVDDFSTYRVEYYAPLQKEGDARSYTFQWAGDYPIETLAVQVQQPLTATSLDVTPPLPDESEDSAHLKYREGTFSSLPAGETFTLSIQYTKADDALSVSSMPVQPANTPPQNGKFFSEKTLPWIFSGAGFLLILGGLLYYFFGGKMQTGKKSVRRARHASRPRAPKESPAGQAVYCHQCGTRAQPGDKFCRVCGARLREDG